jgi:stage II sporulation protein D
MSNNHSKIRKFAAFILIAVLLLSTYAVTYASPVIPETIRVGLNYNVTTTNNFIIKSDGGMNVSLKSTTDYVDLFSYAPATGLKIRKDSFYNIINNKETEITYVPGNPYTGEVIGSYHIQIGDVYPDINSAKAILDRAAAATPSAFLAYDGGWKVWAQLYVDEASCLKQIDVLKAAMPDLNYSVIAPDKKRVQLFDAATGQLLYIINAEQDLKFDPIPVPDKVPTVYFNTRNYRGNIYIRRMATGVVNVANQLGFEEYLYGVVPSEMPNSWPMEALKAQAVAARNYGLYNFGKHASDGYDVDSSTDCQAYEGYSHENARTTQAVNETAGKLVLYNDKIIPAYFHSSSGGRTEDSENVWSYNLPYIRGVDDSYGLGSPYDNWTKKFDKAAIKAKLTAAKIDVGDITDLVPLEISENGRVTKLQIVGTTGSQVLEKEKVRSIFGYSDIKSTWYNISTDADLFVKDGTNNKPELNRASEVYVVSATGVTKLSSPNNQFSIKDQSTVITSNIIPQYYSFNGHGWGHGLGMSQYGAKGMAEAGFNYVQILEHYFTGTEVK